MEHNIPDGEYELDFSNLFSTFGSEVFGVRFGFKPDTIDQSYPSLLYKDTSNIKNNNTNNNSINEFNNDVKTDTNDVEIPYYLVSESKLNTKAITTDHKKDQHIYFEGRSSRQNINSTSISMNSSPLLNGDIPHGGTHTEFLLSFDDVSKSFKVDNFQGFIKMNKSREPELISNRIKKMKSMNKPLKNTNQQSYIDWILSKSENFSTNGNNNDTTTNKNNHNTSINSINSINSNNSSIDIIKTITPIKVNRIPILSDPMKVSKSYEKSISKISPVRRKTTTSVMNSPIRSTLNSPNLTTPNLTTPSPITLSKPLSPLRNESDSPILKTSRSGSNTSNGGTGVRKSQKSLLLRKAERAVGIKNSRITKPKIDSARISNNNAKKSISTTNSGMSDIDDMKRNIDNTSSKISQRVIKEAKPSHTSYELILTPDSLPVEFEVKKSEGKLEKGVAKVEGTIESKSHVNEKVKKEAKSVNMPLNDDHSDFENLAEELESEMDVVDELNELDEDNTKDMNIELKTKTKTKTNPKLKSESASESIPQSKSELKSTPIEDSIENNTLDEAKPGNNDTSIPKEEMEGDEFNIDFSDWEDADALGGPVISDDNDTLTGNNDFQLIIEDDPLNAKRENDKEMKRRRQMEEEENIKWEKELERKEREIKLQHRNDMSNKKANTTTTTNTTKNTKGTDVGVKTVKSKPKAKKNVSTTIQTGKQDTHEDIDELDAELDKAFDDLLDEEDMSEEE